MTLSTEVTSQISLMKNLRFLEKTIIKLGVSSLLKINLMKDSRIRKLMRKKFNNHIKNKS